MSTETFLAACEALLRDAGAAAEARQTPIWKRRPCPRDGSGYHLTLRAPVDPGRWPDNITLPGWVCLSCGLLFGGGLGMYDLRAEAPR